MTAKKTRSKSTNSTKKTTSRKTKKSTVRTLNWSIPGSAVATVLFESQDPNHVVVAQLIPGVAFDQAKRGTIGDRPTSDDLIDIENFDLILPNIKKANDRKISVSLLHEKKQFNLFLAFSFMGAPNNPGQVFEVQTNKSGVTAFDIKVKI